MVRNRVGFALYLGLFLLSVASFAAGPVPSDPLYIRLDDGWKGVYGRGGQYAEYSIHGTEVKLQDPYHILLKQRLGMMVTFADEKDFGGRGDLLTRHAEWELAHWRQRAASVESSTRTDLSGGRNDLRVTEVTLHNAAGAQTKFYILALAADEGVFAISIAPADSNIDSLAGEIASSFKLVRHALDPDEVKRLSIAARSHS